MNKDPSSQTPMPGGSAGQANSAPVQNRPMIYVCGNCHKVKIMLLLFEKII
jgi:hypothetical protein